MKSPTSGSRFLRLSRKATTGGVTTPQNPGGGDGEFPEMAEKENSGVGWVEMGDEKAHRMPLVRQSKGIPEKAASRGGSHRREAVLVLAFHTVRYGFARGVSSWDGHCWVADEPAVRHMIEHVQMTEEDSFCRRLPKDDLVG